MTDFFNPRLALGLTNRYPLAYIKSREERRLVKQLESLSKTHYGDSRPVHIWTCSEGLDGNVAWQILWLSFVTSEAPAMTGFSC